MAGEKRTQDQEDSLLKESVIIVDIEGTTTSISFVKETLFPYVRENLKQYLDTKWDDEEFKRDVDKLKEQAKKDEDDKIEGLVPITGANAEEEKESILKNVLWQMDGDRKTEALKQLQGHMWREAYDSGKIKGHIYEDVPECLKAWTNNGKKVYVYSSGSVEAQKLLFGHSEHGDLLEYFSGYFDTAVGMKQEVASYKNILDQIKAQATDVIFLTDIVKEAKAAKEAGLSSIIIIREGNAALSADEKTEYRTATSFLDLSFLNAAKRQKLDTAEISKEQSKAEQVTEKMEISEDVEMTDVSDKESKSKVESNDSMKEEQNETADKNGLEALPASETKVEKEEAMETDGKVEDVKKSDEAVADTKSGEGVTESKVEKVESEKECENVGKDDEKPEETATKSVEKNNKVCQKQEGSVEKSTTDETDKAVLADSNKTEVSAKSGELIEKNSDAAKPEPPTVNNEAMEECAQAQDVKAAKVAEDATTETKKTEDSEKTPDLSKAKVETETENGEVKSAPAPLDSCTKPSEAEKTDAKIESVATEVEKIAKSSETSTKAEEPVPKSDEVRVKETVKENGTAKTDVSSKTETENATVSAEKKDSSDVAKTEPKLTETVTESKDSLDTNSKDETKAADSVVADAKKELETKDSDVTKSEEGKDSDKEAAKNDTTEVLKESASVTEPVKKINGTTQNGETVTSDENKEVHTNGVNEACTSDAAETKTNKEASTQKREPECSTDASAESIKVKKVVDSTAADGAGEPDVVPPSAVAVAATS